MEGNGKAVVVDVVGAKGFDQHKLGRMHWEHWIGPLIELDRLS